MFRSRVSKQSDIHAWWSTLPTSSRSLLVSWPSGLPQENSWDAMSAGEFACHTMGCAPTGYRDVAAALGCSWGVGGTLVGHGSTAPPHIYT